MMSQGITIFQIKHADTWVSDVDWPGVLSFHESNEAINLVHFKQIIRLGTSISECRMGLIEVKQKYIFCIPCQRQNRNCGFEFQVFGPSMVHH